MSQNFVGGNTIAFPAKYWTRQSGHSHPTTNFTRLLLISLCISTIAPSSALAGALQVAPVTVEIPPNGNTSKITLENQGADPINAQIRVFRWSQENGEETLTPTTDVVASPPAASLAPGQEYTVRIVRVAQTPPTSEETYRLLVDELPHPSDDGNSKINFVVRYSLPIFFTKAGARAQVDWKADLVGDKLRITARNDGERHMRIVRLKIDSSSGHNASFGDGLIGYVLPHATMSWSTPANGLAPGDKVEISAQGNNVELGISAILQSAAE